MVNVDDTAIAELNFFSDWCTPWEILIRHCKRGATYDWYKKNFEEYSTDKPTCPVSSVLEYPGRLVTPHAEYREKD